jgi:hypothetical protein
MHGEGMHGNKVRVALQSALPNGSAGEGVFVSCLYLDFLSSFGQVTWTPPEEANVDVGVGVLLQCVAMSTTLSTSATTAHVEILQCKLVRPTGCSAQAALLSLVPSHYKVVCWLPLPSRTSVPLLPALFLLHPTA